MGGLRYGIYKILTAANLISPKVIVVMDGGVCSQMNQYLLAHCYAKKGLHVCFDLSFFEKWGSDLNYHFVRNFDLLKAFPYLPLKKASETRINDYRRKCYVIGNNTMGHRRLDDYSFLQYKSPLYLAGYYQLPPNLFLEAFHSCFQLTPKILNKPNRQLCDEIRNQSSAIAVHVRRGDLKSEVFAYGKPATLEYFQRAIRFFQERVSTPYFYFFSDEPDWVAEELTPKLSLENNFKVVNINGSDCGYMDLYLIAYCKHQITSKGTLGKYGALLTDCPEKYVVLCDDITEYGWKELLQNPHFL